MPEHATERLGYTPPVLSATKHFNLAPLLCDESLRGMQAASLGKGLSRITTVGELIWQLTTLQMTVTHRHWSNSRDCFSMRSREFFNPPLTANIFSSTRRLRGCTGMNLRQT